MFIFIRNQPTLAGSLLLWAGVLLLGIGFLINQTWQTLPLNRAVESAILAGISLIFARTLKKFWGIASINAVVLFWGLLLIYFTGAIPVFVTLLLAISGLAIGSWIMPECYGRSVVIPTLTGLGFIAGLVGWLLPFPLHYQAVYWIALLIPIVLRRHALISHFTEIYANWQKEIVTDSTRTTIFAVTTLGLASTGCWIPTIQFDDLAYHLGMPWQLATLGYYRLDAHSQIWALAPWSGDVIQSIVQVASGTEARGAVNALWLLLAAATLWKLAQILNVQKWAHWLSIALFASLPLTTSLLGGMHAELPATVVLLGLALAVSAALSTPDKRVFCSVLILAGFLLGLKTGFLAAIIPMGVWLMWRWRGRLPWKALPVGLGLLVIVAGSSYIYAYYLTGNPFLPLMNGVFRSPFLEPVNIFDPRWTAGGGLTLPWQLVFHTSRYMECWDGAAGFSLVGLAGAVIAAVFLPAMRPLAVISIVAFAIPITTVNYLRYGYPALVLMAPVMVGATAVFSSSSIAKKLLIGLCVLNLAYQTCSMWILKIGTVKQFLLNPSAESLFRRLVPERVIAKFIRENDPTAVTLFSTPKAPFVAELAGQALATEWYDPELRAAAMKAETDPSGKEWQSLLASIGADYVVVSTLKRSLSIESALAAVNAKVAYTVPPLELWKLPQNAASPNFVEQRDLAKARFRW